MIRGCVFYVFFWYLCGFILCIVQRAWNFLDIERELGKKIWRVAYLGFLDLEAQMYWTTLMYIKISIRT